jgi:hypothetical protein
MILFDCFSVIFVSIHSVPLIIVGNRMWVGLVQYFLESKNHCRVRYSHHDRIMVYVTLALVPVSVFVARPS